jgi:murein DD-endopeptidase MepM/ murein hydrolase activator NlpD
MSNFAEIHQMGRVSSQLRHDYKPGITLPDRRVPHRRLLLGIVFLVLGAVLFMFLEKASGTRQLPESSATQSAKNMQRVVIALPGRDAGSENLNLAVETGAEEVDAGDPSSAALDGEPPDPEILPEGEQLTVTVKPGDSLDRLFRRHGLSVADLAAMLKLKEAKNALAVIKPGDDIQLVRREDRVLALSRELSEELTLRLARDGDSFVAEFLANPVERRPAYARGRIESSLFEAGADAGLSDTLIMNLAGVFAWDVDFALEIREGDSFSLVYEEVWQDEQRLRDGDVLAAEFVNQGRVYRAVRYRDPNGKVDYYTPEGLSVRKAFLRAPLDFSRVSSNFNPNRLHPILKTKRPHKGVDYAAPKGTPVKAAGDGRVIFRGRNGGYGNCVIIQHGGNVTTLYGHLSKFAKSAPKGGRVTQGQVIGYVGATGLATAAHLHYEYRLNGVHRNPRTVPLPEAAPVAAEYRDDFIQASRPLLAQLDAITPTRLARAD